MAAQCRSFLFILFLVGLTSHEGNAQIITGTVRDSLSREQVPGALVILLTADSSYLTQTATNEIGAFRLPAPTPGEYRVLVRAMGYAQGITEPLTVADREETEVSVLLRVDPVALDSLEVVTESRTRQLELVGFYKRKEFTGGYFIEREEIDRSHAGQVTDLFYGIPGLRVVRGQRTGELDVLLRGGKATFVLDGMILDRGAGPIDEVIHPYNIEAIEIIPNVAEVPVQYRSSRNPAGVILIWTRR